MSKIKVSELKCFGQVSDIIGKSQAEIELFKVLSVAEECDFEDDKALVDAFVWGETPQGHRFWNSIHGEINPYDN
ncbi:hypothetical protein NVP2095A_75 [Vibrio phage 2.095.A._10N.286.46.E10]|nr:hypothetical protein NVP2095A_75 [Vibrio phage 2.095.A._10N.286.46.E10]AUS02233.1 hypothetical protein NVP2095B_75 [Vibrio phage 2.095.B._10N.286.46.E10]